MNDREREALIAHCAPGTAPCGIPLDGDHWAVATDGHRALFLRVDANEFAVLPILIAGYPNAERQLVRMLNNVLLTAEPRETDSDAIREWIFEHGTSSALVDAFADVHAQAPGIVPTSSWAWDRRLLIDGVSVMPSGQIEVRVGMEGQLLLSAPSWHLMLMRLEGDVGRFPVLATREIDHG